MSATGPEVPAGPARAGWQPVGRVDLARLPATSLAQGAGALLLFLSLQLPWYTVSTAAATGSASAMVAGGWRWLIWLLSLGTVVYLFLRSVTTWRDPPWLSEGSRRSQVLAGVAGLNFVLVLIAAFASKAKPPSIVPLPRGIGVGTAIGAYLAVILAIAVLVAAVLELLEPAPRVGGHPNARRVGTVPAPEPTLPTVDPAAEMRGTAAPPAPLPPSVALEGARRTPAGPHRPPRPTEQHPPQRPAEPGSGPPTGWMPPQPPPPPPL